VLVSYGVESLTAVKLHMVTYALTRPLHPGAYCTYRPHCGRLLARVGKLLRGDTSASRHASSRHAADIADWIGWNAHGLTGP